MWNKFYIFKCYVYNKKGKRMKYNSTFLKYGLLILVGIISTGCSYNVPKYGISAKNVNSIKNIKPKINIGNFTSKEKNKNSITLI